MAELAGIKIIVHGRVQGVFFRDYTRQHAEQLGLTGYARNLPGGREVEVVAEGRRGNLEALLAVVYAGPPLASVESVDTNWLEYTGKYADFRVAR